MATRIEVLNRRSHSARIGKNTYKFERGKPFFTSDQEVIDYCKRMPPGTFGITHFADPPKKVVAKELPPISSKVIIQREDDEQSEEDDEEEKPVRVTKKKKHRRVKVKLDAD